MYISEYMSPIGTITIESDGNAITGLWIQQQRYFPELKNCEEGSHLPVIGQTKEWLDHYFSGSGRILPLPPLAPKGTAFQKRVWNALLDIPLGQTCTYGQISARIFGNTAIGARAVGHAVGKNQISILIPCHRVLPAVGGVGQYAGGTHRKEFLLKLENKTSE